MKLPITSVTIPPDRFREADREAVDALKVSFAKFGQLQPIVTDEAFVLVSGLHRLTAAREMGWTEIDLVTKGELTELKRREIELEENVRRKDMTWQERARALSELHRLKVAEDPTWGLQQTSEIAGVQKSRISESDTVLKMMELFPEIGQADSLRKATKLAYDKAKQIGRVMAVKTSIVDYADIESKIVLGDSIDVIKSIPDNSIDHVITDPPFGVDYEQRTAGSGVSTLSSYEDSKESYLRILSMAPDIYRVIRQDGFLVWFCGISWYEEVKRVFRGAGFTVDEIPIIWDRSEGRTFTTRPDRWFTRGYDIAIHAIKGNPVLAQRGKSNIIRVAPVSQGERELLVERPVELYAELIRRLTIPGETVADFFVGSGSCLAAAAQLGRKYFGVELSAERRAFAIQKVKSYTPDVVEK